MNVNPLENLINYIAKLPGLGKRSSRRVVLHLLKNREKLMLPIAKSLIDVSEKILTCEICGNYDLSSPCEVCTSHKRDQATILVVEDVSDLWAIEKGGIYSGLYHVLGGALSAIDGISPEKLNINNLFKRLYDGKVKEVIIATNATMEGQTTAHYLNQKLLSVNVKTTRLAQGVPLGGELEFLDEGTLLAALNSRKEI